MQSLHVLMISLCHGGCFPIPIKGHGYLSCQTPHNIYSLFLKFQYSLENWRQLQFVGCSWHWDVKCDQFSIINLMHVIALFPYLGVVFQCRYFYINFEPCNWLRMTGGLMQVVFEGRRSYIAITAVTIIEWIIMGGRSKHMNIVNECNLIKQSKPTNSHTTNGDIQ